MKILCVRRAADEMRTLLENTKKQEPRRHDGHNEPAIVNSCVVSSWLISFLLRLFMVSSCVDRERLQILFTWI